MWRAIATVLVVVFMNGCVAEVEPPKARIVIPAVTVDTGPGGGFCPPGQAKKGRC